MKTRFILLAALIFSAVAQAGAVGLAEAGAQFTEMFTPYASEHEGTTSFRSLVIPSGGRSESMGGACVATGDDSSFFDYNPAASAVLEQTEAAVFHNAWIADSALETVAASIRGDRLGAGAQLRCFYVPFTEYDSYGERVAGSYYSETALTLNAAYNFFSSYRFKGVAVGVNVRAAWRSVPDYADSTGTVISGSGLAQSALALMADVGVLVRYNAVKFHDSREPNIKMGLALMNAGAALTGFGRGVHQDDPLPTRVSAGISYRPIAPLTIAVEFRQPLNLQVPSEREQWSACTGFEFAVTRNFNFLGGFLLQSGAPRISMGGGLIVRGVAVNVNYTFDVTSSFNPVNHISLSATLRLGDRGRAERQHTVDEHYLRGLSLYAQGTRDSIECAIEEWDAVLRLDPRFSPAAEARKAAMELLAAHDSITSISRLRTKDSDPEE